MAKFIKKKINVLLLVLLLFFAAVPGILYLIYCSVPTKIPEKAPKSNGALLRLIGSGLTLLFYIVSFIYFGVEEGLLVAILGMGTGFAGLVLALNLISLKAKGTGIFTIIGVLNIFTLLVTVLYCIFLSIVFYLWIELPMLIGIIITFVGLSNGKKQALYDKYFAKEAE